MKLLSRLTINASRLTARRLVFAFFLLPFSLFLLPPKPALAAFYSKPVTEIESSVYLTPQNEINNDKYIYGSANTTMGGFGIMILGNSSQVPDSKKSQGAVQTIGRAIAAITSRPPVQTKEYLAYMAGKAGFIDPAYAAERGGFDVLAPIQKLWIATRNVAYLITSLTLVVIGFMIMLRKKIDAQTVIGVQQALPKLVITLLLITFSYAIAGFLIDMIYFLTFFGIKLLALSDVFTDAGKAAIETVTSKSIFQIGIRDIFRLGGSTVGGGTPSTGPAETAADAVGNLVTELLGGDQLIAKAGGLISQPIAFVIFAVAILYAVFKLFFSLLMSYVQIILLAILGPLQLMLNALPGSDAFSKWFRNILANAMAFPAAILMIIFASALMGQTGEHWKIDPGIGFTDSAEGVKWIPPLVFGTGAGVSNPIDAVQALLGIGVLLMTPKVVDMVKEWVQAPEFKYGSAIGEAVGKGWEIGGTPVRVPYQIGTGITKMATGAYLESKFRSGEGIGGIARDVSNLLTGRGRGRAGAPTAATGPEGGGVLIR